VRAGEILTKLEVDKINIYWKTKRTHIFQFLKNKINFNMTTIKFWSALDGDEILNPNIGLLRILILYVGKEYWCSGAGEGVVFYKSEEIDSQISIVYSPEYGFAIGYKAWKEDMTTYNNQIKEEEKVTIYIGGEPYYYPNIFFVKPEKAYEVIKQFCKTGERSTESLWVDGSNLDFTIE
jgi:hypothetical protein